MNDFDLLKQQNIIDVAGFEKLLNSNGNFNDNNFRKKESYYKELLSFMSSKIEGFKKNNLGIPFSFLVMDSEGNIIDAFQESTFQITPAINALKKGVQIVDTGKEISAPHLVLRFKKPVAVIGKEHAQKDFHNVACYGVPITNGLDGELIGALVMCIRLEDASPLVLQFLIWSASTIEDGLKGIHQKNNAMSVNQLMMETTSDAIMFADSKGRIIKVNDVAVNMFQLSEQKLVNTDITTDNDLGIKIDLELINSGFKYSQEQNTTFNFDDLQIEKTFIVDAFSIENRLRLNDEEIYIQVKDISELRTHKNKLDKLEKMKDLQKRSEKERNNFLYCMGHEIRSPIHVISCFLEVLQIQLLEYEDMDIEKEYTKTIQGGVKQLNDVVNKLLNFSTVETNRYPYKRNSINIKELLDYVLVALEPLFRDLNLSIFCDEEKLSKIPNVIGDDLALKSVFLSVISNAAKYNIKNGSIRFEFEEIYERLEVSVIDTGKGISKDFLPKLFDNYIRGEGDLNISNGAGLGLSVSKKMLEDMDGFIRIENMDGGGIKAIISMQLDYRQPKKEIY